MNHPARSHLLILILIRPSIITRLSVEIDIDTDMVITTPPSNRQQSRAQIRTHMRLRQP